MRTTITKSFHFDASHILEWHPGACSRLHGHGYRLDVTVEGEPDANGVVMDFDELDGVVTEAVVARLDHSHLNDVIDNPTAERIAEWAWGALDPRLGGLGSVRVYETATTWAEVRR